MSDYADLQSTFDNGLFRTACEDVLRIVSVLSLDSTDVTKPSHKKTLAVRVQQKLIFMSRFFYMVFIKGFTPTIFDLLPFTVWKIISIAVYVYRLVVVPFWLRFTGYGMYADWKEIGTQQPDAADALAKPLKSVSLTKESKLSAVDFGEPEYEKFITVLHKKTTYLSPHSQSPSNPFTHAGFEGNFFDHLTGVYKILFAWKQPQYVVRAGLFHSVYGTFDYRYSLYDLRDGRGELTGLIGPAAEELAFAICTSDRIGLIRDLWKIMYGQDAQPLTSNSSVEDQDGNPFPPLLCTLGKEGVSVRNHITQEMHALNPDFFAQFVVVFIADFMEQGAISLGSADTDVCLFRFMRFRAFNNMLLFVKPYLRSFPPVWEKYMGTKSFVEPSRSEVILFKKLWIDVLELFDKQVNRDCKTDIKFIFSVADTDKSTLLQMVKKYPYLPEPMVVLAASMKNEEKVQVCCKPYRLHVESVSH